MCQYPAGEVRPQPHTKRAARVDVSPVLELHLVAPLLPQIPPHMRASMYGARGISTVACTLATATHVHLHDDQCTCINSGRLQGDIRLTKLAALTLGEQKIIIIIKEFLAVSISKAASAHVSGI